MRGAPNTTGTRCLFVTFAVPSFNGRRGLIKKHRESNCGRHLKHLQRRRQLVNESVEKRLEVLDEAELQEARLRHTERDDTVPLVLTADDRAGWVLRAKDGNASVPLEDATKCWRQAAAVSDLKAGDRVRCSAERFEAQAKKNIRCVLARALFLWQCTKESWEGRARVLVCALRR